MRRLFLLSLMLVVGGTGVTYGARQGNFGLGAQLGNPTGITGKYWLNSNNAIDVTIGLNLLGTSSYGAYGSAWSGSLQMGHLWHFPDLFNTRSGSLLPYIGVGGGLTIVSVSVGGFGYEYEESAFGFYGRIPAGLEYINKSVGFYGELDPVLSVISTSVGSFSGFGLGGGLGVRFYF